MDPRVHSAIADRVRACTWPVVNHRLDRAAQLRLRRTAASGSTDELSARLAALDREWDFERIVETESSLMGLLGLALGFTVDRRLLVLPGLVATMLLVHASHGWYPLLPVFRRLGVRTQDEIDKERYALKAIRGDFTTVPPAGTRAADRAAAAWKAVCES